jgi:microcystin-dependent protein
MAADPLLGEIALFAFPFAPRGWALCAGQLLSIAQNQALFSLLGTTYGGDGITTFGLPDLRGRSIVSSGQALGGSDYTLGMKTGTETVTVLPNQLPMHNHLFTAATTGSTPDPTGALYAATGSMQFAPTATGQLAPDAVAQAGSTQPHPNQPPYLVLNYCIALQGIFPSRD